MRKVAVVFLHLLLIFISFPSWSADISALRLWHAPERSRYVLDMDQLPVFKVLTLKNPDRVVVDINNSKFTGSLPKPDQLGQFVKKIRVGYQKNNQLRLVFDVSKPVRYVVQRLNPINNYKYRLVVDFYDSSTSASTALSKQKKTSPPKKINRQNQEIVIAIDPGHGGEDPGALGKRSQEKDIVLKVSKKLKALIDKEKNMRAYLTRTGDYYIGLRKRTRFARNKNADIFISIHADAFKSPKAAGASVYALSQRGATSEEARWLANKENAADLVGGASIADKEDIVAEVMLDMSITKTVEDSLELGGYVLSELKKIGKLHSTRVEQAGFAVLRSPDIPSILVETAYISNPKEEKSLNNSRYQDKLAIGILTGVKQYLKNNKLGYGL